ncbi:ATP-binding protein [Legionella pneumophila 130b]|nr:ATP-binding protein [Legionella pneumophila]WBV64638.1 ATP-binding protein [Legionella pneumophila 130b]WBV70118.1 ATP-binding protein [Legionella pneumophila]WBV72975.1 ATP-binding protein [Legionella pneumophila]
MFQLFQTLQPRDKLETSGVGLSIAKKIVEFQGGKISVESEKNKGSVFRFLWPKDKEIGDAC